MSRKLAGSIVPPWLLGYLWRHLCAEASCGSCLPQVSSHGLSMRDEKMAGPTGFEPATSRLTIWRPKPG